METTPLTIKETRIRIDGTAQYINELIASSPSKMLVACYGALLMGKGWLGKCLAEMGVETPYKNDGARHTVADIEPTADTGNVNDKASLTYSVPWSELNHVEKIDFMRGKIEELVISVKDFDLSSEANAVPVRRTREFAIARTNAYSELCEAKMHLGFELQRLKETATAKSDKGILHLIGHELISEERMQQVFKHKRTLEHDVLNNKDGQLAVAAGYLLNRFIEPGSAIIPLGWDKKAWQYLLAKPFRERVIIAGALCAAEVDRLDAVKNGMFEQK